MTGIYKGGVFNFSFVINPNYPHEPPKVRCLEKVSCHLPFEIATRYFYRSPADITRSIIPTWTWRGMSACELMYMPQSPDQS